MTSCSRAIRVLSLRGGCDERNQSMNKTELVDKIAQEAGLSKKDADQALRSALDAITDAVATGEKVSLPGFGTFERRERAAREGRNPQTGASLKIPKSQVPAFKAGATFKSYVGMSKKDQAAHRKSR
jgi:DNA-binding protein HU-beta